MKLIDKDALIAEIEKAKEHVPFYPTLAEKDAYIDGMNDALDKIYSLKVKEVDLEKEVEKCLKQYKMLAVGKKDFTTIARHFFGLGIKAQKGE